MYITRVNVESAEEKEMNFKSLEEEEIIINRWHLKLFHVLMRLTLQFKDSAGFQWYREGHDQDRDRAAGPSLLLPGAAMISEGLGELWAPRASCSPLMFWIIPWCISIFMIYLTTNSCKLCMWFVQSCDSHGWVPKFPSWQGSSPYQGDHSILLQPSVIWQP